MAIGTGQVKVSDIATEMGGLNQFNVNAGDVHFADWSRKLWKGGPTNYATFKETRYYGAYCTFSTVVAAQGTGLAGMNAKPCGIGEWKGYTHAPSTIGSDPLTGAGGVNAATAAHDTYEIQSVAGSNSVPSGAGIAVWAEKDTADGGTVYIKLADVSGSYDNTGHSTNEYSYNGMSETSLIALGANDGAGAASGSATTGTSLPSVTLMKFTDAARITKCSMSMQSGLSITHTGDAFAIQDYDAFTYSGSKVVNVDYDTGSPGASSGILGSTKIGYDVVMGGWYKFSGIGGGNTFDEAVSSGTFGVEFNFYATNSDDLVLDGNPAGPEGFRSFKVTVYVGLQCDAGTEMI